MRLPKTLVRKIVIAAVALVLAACIALFIKESLDEQNPEDSLPLIHVTYGDVAMDGVYRAGWEWRFFLTVDKNTPLLLPEDLPLKPVTMPINTQLQVTFSTQPETLEISIANGKFSGLYATVSEVTADGSFLAPALPGEYVYKVEASWDHGSILYYFSVNVVAS